MDEDDILRQLTAWSASHEVHICLDLASAPDGCQRVTGQWSSRQAHNLFDDVQADDAESIAPHLLAVEPHDTGKWLKRSVQVAMQRPAVTWIFGDLPTQELTQRLKRRMDVEFTDEQSLMLRFFDPRILAELQACLRADMAKQFFAVGAIWAYLDRDGQLQHINGESPNQQDPLTTPIVLDQAEQDALLLASEAGQVMTETLQKWPDDLVQLRPLNRFALSKAACVQADLLELTALSDKVLLLHAAAQGAHCFESPGWKEQAVLLRKGQVSLNQLVLGKQA